MVAITSGANMNFDRLRLVTELAGVGAAEAMLATNIPETPGAFMVGGWVGVRSGLGGVKCVRWWEFGGGGRGG